MISIEYWEISRLKPYARNARFHPEKQIERLRSMIREFQFCAPIGVEPDGTIVFGHGRKIAAEAEGLASVPVIVLSHLTPEKARKLRVADNQIANLSEWDIELLTEEVRAILSVEPEIDPAILGMDERDIEVILANKEDLARLAGEENPPILRNFAITVEVGSEADQRSLYDELSKRGLRVKLLTF
jgi:ParB-like chromosome segregation protein Spo0J